VRVAVGSVAHKPWRLEQAESLLIGALPNAEHFALLADALLRDAKGQGANDFKIPMARRAIVRALEVAAAGTPDPVGGGNDDGHDGGDGPEPHTNEGTHA
jgi:xanthine dehydrogenase YagS FAD-binding subunit